MDFAGRFYSLVWSTDRQSGCIDPPYLFLLLGLQLEQHPPDPRRGGCSLQGKDGHLGEFGVTNCRGVFEQMRAQVLFWASLASCPGRGAAAACAGPLLRAFRWDQGVLVVAVFSRNNVQTPQHTAMHLGGLVAALQLPTWGNPHAVLAAVASTHATAVAGGSCDLGQRRCHWPSLWSMPGRSLFDTTTHVSQSWQYVSPDASLTVQRECLQPSIDVGCS